MKQSFGFPAASHCSSGEYEPADPDKGTPATLTIQFDNGTIYAYSGVPQDVVDRLKEAESPGRFLNAEIKNRFSVEKLA